MNFSLLKIIISTLIYCTVMQILLLSFLLYASIKKHPIPKIVGIGLLFTLHILNFIGLWSIESKIAELSEIPHFLGTLYNLNVVISIVCFVSSVLLLGINGRLERWLIYSWSAIVGLFNILWTGGFFYISQTYMEIYNDFDYAVRRCNEKFLGLKLEDLIDRVFYINLFFLLALLVIAIIIPVYRRFKKTENP